MAAARKSVLRLRITGPDGSIVEEVADSDSVILGSGAQAAVKLRGPEVSHLHCMLKVDAKGMVTAIDLGSETGTKVGNQPLSFPTPLNPGDVLTVGSSQIKVLYLDAEPATPPAPHRVEQVAPPGLNRIAPPPFNAAPARPVVAPHLREPLPPEAAPLPAARVLQVSALWGDTVLDVQHFADHRPVYVGEGKGNDFLVYPKEGGERWPLAVSTKEGLVLSLPASAGLIVTEHGHIHSRDALRQSGHLKDGNGQQKETLTLGLHHRAELSFGELSFVLRYVRPSPALEVHRPAARDFTFLAMAATFFVAFAALVAAFRLTPREPVSADDWKREQNRVAKFLIAPQSKRVQGKELSGAKEGAKAKDEEGKMGLEEAKKLEAEPSKPDNQAMDPQARERARQKVAKVGLLGAFAGLSKGKASTVFGPGGLGTGVNEALGGLKSGAGMGDAQGVGGAGSRGSGPGGGGAAMGLGGLGTQGTGRGTGGSGGIELGGRGKDITKIIPGRTTVVGGLDKEVIQKIIKRHQREIKYCYESELNKQPDLAGKVAVAFTIDAAGSVAEASVSESTLGSTPAEQCMLSRIRRWKFPEPKGGGVVAVNYPWMFAPAGGEGGN